MADTIADGKVVQIHYTLTDGEGQQIDTSRGRDPLAYLHGAENIVPGLESQLTGRSVGDALTAVVEPADGYGVRDPAAVQVVSRDAFPADAQIAPGVQFFLENQAGQVMPVWVAKVEASEVTLDTNHPLAGVQLHFEVEVVGIRAASAEEVAHGHPHGPGGHHH